MSEPRCICPPNVPLGLTSAALPGIPVRCPVHDTGPLVVFSADPSAGASIPVSNAVGVLVDQGTVDRLRERVERLERAVTSLAQLALLNDPKALALVKKIVEGRDT